MTNKSNSNSLENETLTADDINHIIKLSQDPDIYQRLIYSVAPNIPGNQRIKELLLLMIVNSVDKQNSMELHTGAINILIISDSKFDKSELFNSINIISPNWNTNTNDELDDNLICIEHSNNINDADLHKLLQSNNDIIIISNPKNNKFDYYKNKYEQLDLSPLTFSYIDLVFLVEDIEISEKDYGKYNKLAIEILKIHGIYKENYIEYDLLKKYLIYAHENFHPYLTDEAFYFLKDLYVYPEIYNSNDSREGSITFRHFQFIIRLAEAISKIKLKNAIDSEDITNAIKLILPGIQNYIFDPILIDYFNINTPPKSDSEIIPIIIKEIEVLENEFNESIPLNVLYSNMSEKYNIDEKITYQLLQMLINKGVIYENPKYHFHLVC